MAYRAGHTVYNVAYIYSIVSINAEMYAVEIIPVHKNSVKGFCCIVNPCRFPIRKGGSILIFIIQE